MEESSLKRKERLAKLKRTAEDDSELRFRSYEPETENLKTYVTDQPSIGEAANKNSQTVESETLKIQNESVIDSTFEIEKLQKKQDWDLKRGIESKLKILQKKTDIAIADIIS
jgi:hypothetical protein